MATVVLVHGTFAHAINNSGPEGADPQWWQPGSTFDKDLGQLVQGRDGRMSTERFQWSGENSELDRREAGKRLAKRLRELEAAKEAYCLVGHSHGGSVISTALVECAARKQPLEGLKRWITVGTPFVRLKREPLLFTRLNLPSRVVFVASMMLLIMFLVYFLSDITSIGRPMLFGSTFPAVLAVTALLMSLPAIVFYLVLRYLDARTHAHLRPAVQARAREAFAGRWLPLTHADDEAVQGLAALPGARFEVFDRSFAVGTITMISIFAMPLLYLMLLNSPGMMVQVADWMKSSLYESRVTPETEKALRDMRIKLREARKAAGAGGAPVDAKARQAMLKDYRAIRQGLEARYPDLKSAERALRFKQRFFEQDGKPCEGAKLCGGGNDLRVNSGLLLHVATDELSWALGAEDADTFWMRRIWSMLVPAILVPLISVLIALAIMLLVQLVARAVSRLASALLNSLTNAEVKRVAYGNDTEGEHAVAATDRPEWIEHSPQRLPAELGGIVTSFSNEIATHSLVKLRKAIGSLASGEPSRQTGDALTSYFTWKELVHASYFDVPEVRRLLVLAVSQADGFQPAPGLANSPDFARTSSWLAALSPARPPSKP